MSVDPEQIAALLKEGKHGDAARLYEESGDLVRAAELQAEIWAYDEAARLASTAERFDLVYSYAVLASDRAAALRAMVELAERPSQARAAGEFAELRSRHGEAARLFELGGDFAGAARAFEASGELSEAARNHVALGGLRDAGRLYERHLRDEPEDGNAHLELGRILVGFGRHEHAVRSLQEATRFDEVQEPALRLLVACFAAMGMEEAANSRLAALIKLAPGTPQLVSQFLEHAYGDARGLLADDDDERPLLAGRYRVEQDIGAGATGRVMRATDTFYDREVAVKVLTVGGGTGGRDAYVRFAKEARVAAGVEHPNVVRVHEYNAAGPFLVMELMSGGTLAERLGEGQPAMQLSAVRQVVNGVLNGLSVVHSRGVVHRDLKPENIFFAPTGEPKIGDFGVAHLTDLGSTMTGALLGTLAYMTPEQITGSHRPDASTDLYSVGVLLFQMLTRGLPYPGPDFVSQHLRDPIPLVSERASHLGTRFDELLTRMLAKAQTDRFSSATETRAALDELDWTEPDGVASSWLEGDGSSSVTITKSSSEGARYTAAAGGMLRDTLLDRLLRREDVTAARAARLRELSKVGAFHLQSVYDINEEGALVQVPEGEPLSRALLSAEERAQVRLDIEDAVRKLHEAGVVHGQVLPSRIFVQDGHGVLLLPDGESAAGTIDTDLAALASI